MQAGQDTIAALGLTDIELLHLDILGMDERFGTFDYVIVHGVYSWVPREVQDRILQICSHCLSEHGVAYVSYNTNPGWRMRGLLRDMMLYHSRKFDDSKIRVDQARALVEWLAQTVESENNPYGMLLKCELENPSAACWAPHCWPAIRKGCVNCTRMPRCSLPYLATAPVPAR